MPKECSILVVDDEPSVLEILDQFLTEREYSVRCAATGAEALDLLEIDSFEVALIDLKLPDISGLDLILHINNKFPGIKCIIMTAFASLESTIEALRLNAYDYILKPFDLIKIAEVVDAAYNYTRMTRENTGIIDGLEAANRKLEESKSELNRRILQINEELGVANESLKKHVTRLKMLYQMGRDISSNENWSDALDRFLMALNKYLEAEGTALFMFSDGETALKVRTSFGLDEQLLERAVDMLKRAKERDYLQPEIFNLEGCDEGQAETCLGMKKPWDNSMIPLLFKGKWLGFLLIRKHYRARNQYLNDYHFINTIQTILTEEVANAVNISRLRNLKDFNETILENINSGVIKTDRDGRIVFLNKRAREILGSVPGDLLLFNEIFQNPYGSGDLFEHLIAEKDGDSTLEGILQIGEKDPVPVRLSYTRVRTDDFAGATLVAVFEDLTAQKAMEEELRRADRLRSLGELSAGVAHEIRNPLTGIATTAQVLREQLGGETEKIKYLTVILDEIRRLDEIIRNLLNFARPQHPDPVEIDLDSLIAETIHLMSDEAVQHGVSINFESQLEDGQCLLDRDQIKQVILNIGMNGIEACDPGGELIIYLKRGVDPVFVRIEFLDNGRGVSADIADKLYNPFFTTRSEGTGLGLSITRKIIESHGGRIFHESDGQAGTRFIVELPRRIVASPKTIEAKQVS